MLDATYDVLLYDTVPSLDHVATGYAVQQSEVAVVVTTPSPADIWEAKEVVQFVHTHNPDAEVHLVCNKVRRGTVLARLTAESAKEVSAPALSTMISDRECYQHAIGEGWRALDGAAREEVFQLTVALLSLGRRRPMLASY